MYCPRDSIPFPDDSRVIPSAIPLPLSRLLRYLIPSVGSDTPILCGPVLNRTVNYARDLGSACGLNTVVLTLYSPVFPPSRRD